MNPSQRMEQSKNIHQPQNRDDCNAIQNGLDGSLHLDESVHQPEEHLQRPELRRFGVEA